MVGYLMYTPSNIFHQKQFYSPTKTEKSCCCATSPSTCMDPLTCTKWRWWYVSSTHNFQDFFHGRSTGWGRDTVGGTSMPCLTFWWGVLSWRRMIIKRKLGCKPLCSSNLSCISEAGNVLSLHRLCGCETYLVPSACFTEEIFTFIDSRHKKTLLIGCMKNIHWLPSTVPATTAFNMTQKTGTTGRKLRNMWNARRPGIELTTANLLTLLWKRIEKDPGSLYSLSNESVRFM